MKGSSQQKLFNRNEITQGPSPKCMEVISNFEPKHVSLYFDGYFGSILIPKLSTIFNLPKEQIMLGYGTENIFRMIFDSLSPGKDTVLTYTPSYTFYSKYLEFKGVRLVQSILKDSGDTFELDIEDFITKINELNPKVTLITSPNNPTGNSVKASELSKILEQTDKNSLVILDEAYYGFDNDYDEQAFLYLLNDHDNLIILRSFSKLYALAGMRIGFGLCGKRVKELLRYQDLYLGGSRLLEEVAIAALDSKDYYENLSKEIVTDRTNFIETVNKLSHFKAYNSKANFVFVKVQPEVKSTLESKLDTEDTLISKFIDNERMRVTIGSGQYTRRFLEILNDLDKAA